MAAVNNNHNNDDGHNDDDLDKLIEETQAIWKALKHSGIEVQSTPIPNNNTNISSINESSNIDDIKLDGIDKLVSDFRPSALQFDRINTNNNNQNNIHMNNNNNNNNTNDLVLSPSSPKPSQSRALLGLDLAKPLSDWKPLFPSGIKESSQLSPSSRFRTPSEKPKITPLPNSNSVKPPTTISPLIFSPSPLQYRFGGNNHADQSQSEVKLDMVDTKEENWSEVNTMLSKVGLDELDSMVSTTMICLRFKEVLMKYQDMLQREDKDKHAKTQNTELKRQLKVCEEKIQQLKQDNKMMQKDADESDRKNDSMVVNLRRQLDHCKMMLDQKTDDMDRMKRKLELCVEREAAKRKSVEAEFEIIHKRNAKRNNSKDQKELELMQLYQQQRTDMQEEIRMLKKELRSVNDQMIQQKKEMNAQRTSYEANTKAFNVLFTPSSKPVSDNEQEEEKEDKAEDERDNYTLLDLRSKTNKEIKKQIRTLDDLERTKELSRLETSKLREKLHEVYKEKEELESHLHDSKKEVKQLCSELEKRPSYNEWTRLRKELNRMNKELMETRKVASLRKYMDTRELIRRDKELHQLELIQIDSLPVQIMKEILQDLCRTLGIKDVTLLVKNVKKISACVKCVPVLEQYVSKIIRLIISSDHAPGLVRMSQTAPNKMFDQVMPVLKQWIIGLDQVDALNTWRDKVEAMLKKRTIYKRNETKNHRDDDDDDDNGPRLKLHVMIKQIEELVESEEYLLSSKECFNAVDKEVLSNPKDVQHMMIQHFQKIFGVKSVEGIFPKMNQVYVELNAQRNVLKTVKSILGLPENCAINMCFKELQKVMHENKINECKSSDIGVDVVRDNIDQIKISPTVMTKWNSILIEVRTLLDCKNEDEVVPQCKQLITRCKEYDAVFPRVHNLVHQLRTTLDVEYAHEILPKVKQLVASA